MSTHKKIDAVCVAAAILAVVLTVLFMNGEAFGITAIISEEASSDMFTANDLNADWDVAAATKITLSDDGSTITGNGAYVYDGDVYIVYAGCYMLTGELTDGSVIIDADRTDKIWILLNGVALHCGDDAAIRIEQADKVFLTLADGTKSIVSSGAEYNDEVIASGVDGAIYSRDDLTINGTGALVVDAEYSHGIVCNDDFVVTGGDITVSAVQDGIHANDSVRIRNAAISISAGDDGITVSNDDETAFLYVESGTITIPACYEGLEAIDITIAGGTIDIVPLDDGINANGSGANSVIRITGGDITVTNPTGRDADGLDSNGSIYIEGGNTFISVSDSGGNCALDYGTENGGECIITGGTIVACGGSMMAEGFDAASPQGFLMYSTSAEAGTVISLEDSSGRELLSKEVPCGFSSAVLSTPELKLGDACTIVVDGERETVTIDNSSSSGFGQAGMFGGGMRDGRGLAGMPSGQEDRGAQLFSRERDGGRQDGMPQDVLSQPGGQNPADAEGMEPSERPEDVLPADGMAEPGGPAPSGELEPPGGIAPPDGMEQPDRQGIREAGGRPFSPDAEEDGTHSPKQDWEQPYLEGNAAVSSVSAETLALLGISALALLIGLFIAIKTKH